MGGVPGVLAEAAEDHQEVQEEAREDLAELAGDQVEAREVLEERGEEVLVGARKNLIIPERQLQVVEDGRALLLPMMALLWYQAK
ncbi:MAG: hypothetical protein HQL21_09490 [Candidatus Omnitrophica bacterium]|nr:hypothetical protein [Candidatus Omnitrophota bacterium]